MVLLWLILILIVSVQSSSDCKHSCGGIQVSYPFGFSENCEIRLNCTEGSRITIGEFQIKVAEERILVDLPGKCNRSISALTSLFGENYSLTWRNGLLLQTCNSSPSGCVMPRALLHSQYRNVRGCDKLSCFSKERSDDESRFMAYTDLENSSCKFVFSSVAVDGSKGNISLKFETVELEWWLEGRCNCSSNAKCTGILSPVTGRPAFRCRCAQGFVGDGFMAGSGCRGNVGVKLKTGLVVAVVAALVVAAGGCILVFVWLRRKKNKNPANLEAFLKTQGNLALSRYKYSDIKRMTNCFQDKLGQGGYGSVFKGKLPNGRTIAVKLLNETKGDGIEFSNEVASISRTSHVNVVALVGFCVEGSKRALIYEFVPNGSLEKFIHIENNSSRLGWDKLYKIAIGIARGLEYLHRGCYVRILHFDIKPHNILLDQDFTPKISDFGLAKLCQGKDSIVSLTGARGTPGYIAPEVVSRNFGEVSHKSDVYSYGMMVLEMVGGRKNLNAKATNLSEIYFPHWIYKRMGMNEDLELYGVTNAEEDEIARKMVLVGLWCIQMDPADRPGMKKALEMLEGSLQALQTPPKPFLSSPTRDSSSSTVLLS